MKVNIKCLLQFFLIILLFTTKIWSQERIVIEFDSTTFNLKNQLSKDVKDIQIIINEINKLALNDTQKLTLAAGWMYDNINFDLEKFKIGGDIPKYQTVLLSKKGLCGDYASLFAEFCKRLNLKNEIVEGYVKESDDFKDEYKETNHVWNVVKLGDNWLHCDLLWMSGNIWIEKDVTRFEKEVKPENFLTQSTDFIKSHIPADPIWQLTNQPVPLITLLTGKTLPEDPKFFDYKLGIADYVKLNELDKKMLLADNAFVYNPANSSIVVINYFNAAVALLNKNTGNAKVVANAKKYLLKSRKYLEQGNFKDADLETQINSLLKRLN